MVTRAERRRAERGNVTQFKQVDSDGVVLSGASQQRIAQQYAAVVQAQRALAAMLATIAEAVGLTGAVSYDPATGRLFVTKDVPAQVNEQEPAPEGDETS